MNDTGNTQKWQDNDALKRFQTFAPLLDSELDAKKKNASRQRIAKDGDISICTIFR